jgi:hypothetical protein
MPYREDDDALLARADALEIENERLRAALASRAAVPAAPVPATAEAAGPAAADPEPPVDRASAPPRARASLLPWIAGGAACAAAGVLAFVHGGSYLSDPGVPTDPRAAIRARWTALVALEPCVETTLRRMVELPARMPDRYDPRKDPSPDRDHQHINVGGAAQGCIGALQALAVEPALPAEARAAIATWRDADAALAPALDRINSYYGHEDWRDDGFAGAGAVWRAAAKPLATARAGLDAVRAVALPPVRAAIARAADQVRPARPGLSARIEVGQAIRDVVAAGTTALTSRDADEAPAAPAALATAMAGPAARALAALDAAPLEVRRDVRRHRPLLVHAAQGDGDPVGELGELGYEPGDLLSQTAHDDATIPGL